jgi:hypothetical protein
LGEEDVGERFFDEAPAALPGAFAAASAPSAEAVFDGLMLQRATLKRDQQFLE